MSRTAAAALAMLGIAAAARAACDGGWSARAPMAVPRQEIGAAAVGHVLYAVGGFDAAGASAAVESYDAETDRWLPLVSLPAPLHHVGAAAAGGRLLAIGGLSGGSFDAVDAVLAYDPAAAAWLPRAPLPAPRGAMGIAVVGERVYAAGGLRAGRSVDDFAVYDPATDAWTVLAPMPTARDHLAAAALGDRVYAVGGRDGGRLHGVLEVYDPAAGTWDTTRSPMPTPRGGLMAAALGGRLFAFGGEGNARDPLGVFEESEAYDPAADRWSALEPMPTPRHGSVAVVIGGAIHVPGGAVRQGLGVSGAHEALVPPAQAALAVTRATLRGRRLRVRARLAEAPADASARPLVLSLADPAGAPLAQLALPPGGLVARGRRLRHRAPRGGTGVVRLTLVRARRSALRVRLLAVLPAGTHPAGATVVLQLGDAAYCGTGTLRPARQAPGVRVEPSRRERSVAMSAGRFARCRGRRPS